MKYEILITNKKLSSKDISILNKIEGIFILKDIDPLISSYLYCAENIIDKYELYLSNSYHFKRTYQKIDQKDLERFKSNLDKENAIQVNDYVQIDGYGNAVFVAESINSDIVKCVMEIRDQILSVEVKKDIVFKHQEPEKYLYRDYEFSNYKGTILIDMQYLRQINLVDTYQEFLSFLIRIKLQYNRYKLQFLRPNSQEIYIIDLFGFDIVQTVIYADIFITDQLYYIDSFDQILHYDQKKKVFITLYPDQFNKYFFKIKYLLNRKLIPQTVTDNRLKQIIYNGEVEVRFKRYLNLIEELGSNLVYQTFPNKSVNKDKLKKFLDKKNIVFFKENFDFYVKKIKY